MHNMATNTDLELSRREAKPVSVRDLTVSVPGAMEKALWYLLVGTRGGENRVRMIRSLTERPRNANQLSEELDLDYNTVRHHLDVMVDHDVIEKGDSDYGTLYFLTDRFEHHREQFDEIVEKMD